MRSGRTTPESDIRIGTAAWSIPGPVRDDFPGQGSLLERYARRFDAVEINSSFYRVHKPATYRRWASSVPHGFSFSVKLPRTITHERRLVGTEDLLDAFSDEVHNLGSSLGPILIQLPPGLGFDQAEAETFIGQVRDRFAGPLVCEPRHRSWFGRAAQVLFVAQGIARVAADPPPAPGADEPGGWTGLSYRRLHGSPQIYRSDYDPARLDAMAVMLRAAPGSPQWCIFDNTALGFATRNALDMMRRLSPLADSS